MLAQTEDEDPVARAVAGAGPVEAADIRAGLALSAAREHPAIRALAVLGEVGGWQALLALSAGTMAFGLAARDRRLTEAGGRMLAAGVVASLVKTSLKRVVHRTRPNVMRETGRYRFGRNVGPNVGPTQSFPSGHAALSVAVARAAARTCPEARGPAYAAAAGVMAAQVLRGGHFPADVAAGALIGLAAEAGTGRLIAARRPRF